jgi:hypothetical protein
VIHTATHDSGILESRCAPFTPAMERAVELRADKLLAVSKRRVSKGRKVVVVVSCEETGRGCRRDWNLAVALSQRALDSRQVFVEAPSELLEGALGSLRLASSLRRNEVSQKSALLHTSHPGQP